MAFRDTQNKLLSQVRQPGSVLQPKPGVVDAGGNQPTPVLQQAESTGVPSVPKITPKTSPAQPTQSYEQAAAAGTLAPAPSITPASGLKPTELSPTASAQYKGYTTEGSSAGNADILNRIPQTKADTWTPEQWKQAYQEVQGGNPYIAGTVSASGIEKIYNDYISKGLTPDSRTIGVNMGGMWTSDFKPSTVGSVQLQPGEVQTAQGLSKPQITPAGGLNSEMVNPSTRGNTPQITPATGGLTPGAQNLGATGAPPTPPSITESNEPGDDSLSKIFKFFKGDLERERDQGLSDADIESASRGVFYGTPGTTSREAVREKFGRGLGQLQADMLQNESQNELQRLGLATNLFSSLNANDLGRLQIAAGLIPDDQQAEGVDPNTYAAIAQMFGGKSSAGGVQKAAVPNITAQAPKITPATPQAATTLPPFAPQTPKKKVTINKGKY